MPQTVQLPSHRRPPLVIPSEAVEAAAAVTAFIKNGGSPPDRSSALEAFNLRISRLMSPDRSVICEELAAQATVLSALFERYTTDSIAANNIDAKSRLGKLALNAQASLMRTLVALHAFQKPSTCVTVVEGAGDEDQ